MFDFLLWCLNNSKDDFSTDLRFQVSRTLKGNCDSTIFCASTHTFGSVVIAKKICPTCLIKIWKIGSLERIILMERSISFCVPCSFSCHRSFNWSFLPTLMSLHYLALFCADYNLSSLSGQFALLRLVYRGRVESFRTRKGNEYWTVRRNYKLKKL